MWGVVIVSESAVISVKQLTVRFLTLDKALIGLGCIGICSRMCGYLLSISDLLGVASG